MNQDIAIVHLTDLHFPDTGDRPQWANKCLDCLKLVSNRKDLKIEGFAVTGDLTQSPNSNSFNAVKNFFSEALKVTNLIDDSKEPNWSRAWIVGGNHDYRKYGFFGSTEKEIVQSEIALLEEPSDVFNSFRIFGLHSGKKGRVARGRVLYNDLNMVEKCVGAECEEYSKIPKFRIAIIHHHLLPLPQKPPELEISTVRRLKKWIQKETRMLLGNAGLTLKVLMDNSFNIVLHGHKHKQFYALLKEIDESGEWKQPLIVAGCCKASDGFNLLRLRQYGGADILPYRIDEMNYKQNNPVELYSYSEWKSWCWEKEKEDRGNIDNVKAHVVLNEKGDLTGTFETRNIKAGRGGTIDLIPLKSSAVPIGAVEFIELYDFQNEREIGLKTAKVALNTVETDFILNPPATHEKVHKGYKLVRRSYGSCSASTYDAQFRPKLETEIVDDNEEFYSFSVLYPGRHVELWIHFPSTLPPSSIKVISVKKTGADKEHLQTDERSDKIDYSETDRAMNCLHYDSDKGVGIFLIDWVSPDHRYIIKWLLPKIEIEDLVQDNPGSSPYYPLLFEDNIKSPKRSINTFLKNLKQKLLKTELADSNPINEALECGLFALDRKIREVVTVGGTYHIDSNYWLHRFPYGQDIRGLSMSRGRAMIFRTKPGKTPYYYIPYHKCQLDNIVVAVPILIPHNIVPENTEVVIGYYKVVLSLSSTSESSGLIKLYSNSDLRQQMLNYISKKFYYFWEENLTQESTHEYSLPRESTYSSELSANEWILNNEIVEILDWSPTDLNTILISEL